MKNKITLTKSEIITFLFGVLISLLAKGAALFPLSYATDDFKCMLDPLSAERLLSQGRFGAVFVRGLLQALGAAPPHTNTLFIFLGLVSIVLIGILICRLWKISDNVILSSLVVSFIALHPYQAEIFTFKIAGFFGLTLLLSFIGFYFSELKVKTLIWTTLCIVFALSIYQLVLNYIFIVLCFTLLLEIISPSENRKNFKAIVTNTKLLPRLLTVVLGAIIYLILNNIIQTIFHIKPIFRSQFISFNDLPSRIHQINSLILKIFLKAEPILPIILKIFLAIIAILAVLNIFWSILFGITNRNKFYKLISFVTLLVSVFLGIIGVSLLLKDWWPAPRILGSIGIFWSGILVFAYKNSDKRTKILTIILSTIIIIGFAGINNHIFTDQLRLNMRDFHKANRIIGRLEENPEFPKLKTIVIVGEHWDYPSKIDTQYKDMNISAFGPRWSKLNILREVSGYNFSKPTNEDIRIAEKYCKNSKKWPESNSVTIKDGIGIVCF